MVVKPVLFDTNILISSLLHGGGPAASALAQSQEPAISVITWMEVMTGTPREKEEKTRRFLGNFKVVGLEPDAVERAVLLRQSMRLKLPDAIIYATALATGRELVTADRRGFPAGTPDVRHLDLTP